MTPDGNTGEEIYQKLVRNNPEIFMVLTGHSPGESHVALVEAYCKAQGLWRDASTPPAEFTGTKASRSALMNH